MKSVSPVLTENEVCSEQIVAIEQKQYYPIVVARITHRDKMCVSYTRFRLSEKERELIAKGADIVLGQPHHGPMMPISIDVAMPDSIPEEWT